MDSKTSYLRLWKRIEYLRRTNDHPALRDLSNVYVFDVYEFFRNKNKASVKEESFIVSLEQFIADHMGELREVAGKVEEIVPVEKPAKKTETERVVTAPTGRGYPTPASTLGLLDMTLLTREDHYKGVPIKRAIEKLAESALKYETGGICVYPDQLAWVKDLVKGKRLMPMVMCMLENGKTESQTEMAKLHIL